MRLALKYQLNGFPYDLVDVRYDSERVLSGGFSSLLSHHIPVRRLRPNVRLPPRLEGVEIVGPPGAGVYPCYRPQPDTVYPPGVVIYPGQVGLLNAIDPQRQVPIVGAIRRRRLPVQLDKVRRIADRKPTAIDKGHAAVQQGVGPELIVAV